MSAAGRYVAFTSRASNLVPADTNDVEDIFVRDRRTGETTRISVSSTGAQSNGASVFPSMSANGRYVSFHSWANNLVDGDANGVADVFVHDRTSGLTIRVSVDSLGTEADLGGSHSAISANGRYVVFESSASNLVAGITDALGQLDVFVHDLKKRETTRVSMNGAGFPPNGHCGRPSISANGRCVAFQSGATNLDPADSNGVDDVFVHDRKAGWTRRVSIRSDGAEQTEHAFIPTISASGRHISFHSLGSFVGDDTNGSYDVFVHDLKAETTTRASVASDGTEANSDSFENSLSANGRYVAFYSFADNLTNDDSGDHPDVFVHDRKTGKTFRVSTASSGAEANGDSSQIKLSGNGRFAAFASTATNLSSIDTNDAWDVFVRIVK
ncbi:MAG: hypothetical protein JNL94_06655 [Planctomycetes bacterium]|nr:hypothetical protein [Planctomycetota bacterium]